METISRERAKILLQKARARAQANGTTFDARGFLQKVKQRNESVQAQANQVPAALQQSPTPQATEQLEQRELVAPPQDRSFLGSLKSAVTQAPVDAFNAVSAIPRTVGQIATRDDVGVGDFFSQLDKNIGEDRFTGQDIIQGTGTALDLVDGPVRTLAQAGFDENVGIGDSLGRILDGDFTSGQELLASAGVENPSTAGGIATELLASPSTLLTLGGALIPKALGKAGVKAAGRAVDNIDPINLLTRTASDPVSTATTNRIQSAGEALTNQGFRKEDSAAFSGLGTRSAENISDKANEFSRLATKEDLVGNIKKSGDKVNDVTILQETAKTINKKVDRRNDILSRLDKEGIEPDVNPLFDGLSNLRAEIASTPSKSQTADLVKIDKTLNDLVEQFTPTPNSKITNTKVNKFKQSADVEFQDNVLNQNVTNVDKRIGNVIRQADKQILSNSAAELGLGSEFDTLGSEVSTLLDGFNEATKTARSEARKAAATQGDFIAAGINPQIALAKTSGKLFQKRGVQLGFGDTLRKTDKNAVDNLVAKILANTVVRPTRGVINSDDN